MISLLKATDMPWEKARGYLRLDLQTIESAVNQRWADVFGNNNTLNVSVISSASIDLTTKVTGILPIANGGTGVSTVFTKGSVIFAGTSGVYTQDNANFFWDATNHLLIMPTLVGGAGVASPLTLRSTTGVGVAGADIILQTKTNGSLEAMRVSNNGQIQVGTNATILAIGSKFSVTAFSGEYAPIFERQFPGGSGLGAGMVIRYSPSSGVVTNGDGVGYLFQGPNSVGTNITYCSAEGKFTNVAAGSEEGSISYWLAHAGANHSEYLRLSATDTAGLTCIQLHGAALRDLALGANFTEYLRVAQTGMVGIGVGRTVPAQVLDVAGNGAFSTGVMIGTTTFTYPFDLLLGGANAPVVARIQNTGTAANDDSLVYFATQASRSYSIGIKRSTGTFTVAAATASLASNVLFTIDQFSGVGITQTIATYNNITTVSNGVPSELAKIDTTGLTANVGASTLYAVPASGAGWYRVSAYVVETTAGSLSSTLPNIQVVYTDKDSNTSVTLDVTPILAGAGLGESAALTVNAIGTVAAGDVPIYVKASTTIQYQTVNYASNAAGMTYAIHILLEVL